MVIQSQVQGFEVTLESDPLGFQFTHLCEYHRKLLIVLWKEMLKQDQFDIDPGFLFVEIGGVNGCELRYGIGH